MTSRRKRKSHGNRPVKHWGRSPSETRERSHQASEPRDPRQGLLNSLREVLDNLDRLLRRCPADALMPEPTSGVCSIARALLLADKGSHFEQSIRQAIRNYSRAFDNVSRYANSALPEPARSDVLARFREQLSWEEETLRQLQIDTFGATCGEPVKPGHHYVVKTLLCDEADQAGTVANMVSPGFEWIDDQGNRRVHPAKVMAYIAPPSASVRGGRRPSSDAIANSTAGPYADGDDADREHSSTGS